MACNTSRSPKVNAVYFLECVLADSGWGCGCVAASQYHLLIQRCYQKRGRNKQTAEGLLPVKQQFPFRANYRASVTVAHAISHHIVTRSRMGYRQILGIKPAFQHSMFSFGVWVMMTIIMLRLSQSTRNEIDFFSFGETLF